MTDFFLQVPQWGADPNQATIARRRGRRSELEDAQLHNRRDQRVQAFESCWGEIGWELQQCKKPDDLISIFTLLAEGYLLQDMTSVFCRATTETPSATRLRNVRAELRALIEPRYKAQEANHEAHENLKQAERALLQPTRRTYRLIKRYRKQCRKEFAKTAQTQRILLERERDLERQVRDLEASFARRELFRFLKSKRYALTPLNLGNAAAGLPYMGWRQSMRRCKRVRCITENGLYYQVFKAIRYLVRTAKAKTEKTLLDHFRKDIPSLPRRYQLPKVKLAEDWLYVDRAIRQSCRAKPHPKALPFEITKRYIKQIQSRSQVDMVLAQQARLDLSKKTKGSEASRPNSLQN